MFQHSECYHAVHARWVITTLPCDRAADGETFAGTRHQPHILFERHSTVIRHPVLPPVAGPVAWCARCTEVPVPAHLAPPSADLAENTTARAPRPPPRHRLAGGRREAEDLARDSARASDPGIRGATAAKGASTPRKQGASTPACRLRAQGMHTRKLRYGQLFPHRIHLVASSP